MKTTKANFLASGLMFAVSVATLFIDEQRRNLRAQERALDSQSDAKPTEGIKQSPIERTHRIGVAMAAEPQIAVGRIVHFVMASGAVRPAMITNDLKGRCIGPSPLALTVFPALEDRETGDYSHNGTGMMKFPVNFDATGTIPGTWHWPKRE